MTDAEAQATSIEVDSEARILKVQALEISEPEVVDYFLEVPEDEWASHLRTVLRIGVLALRAVGTTERVDYIEKRFSALRSDFEAGLREVFDEDGRIAQVVERFFGDRGEVPEFIEALFGPDGQIVKDLFDPSQKGTPLAKLKDEILEGFVNLRKDLGIQEKEEELIEATALKGGDFEDLVQDLLSETVRPFGDTLERTTDAPGLLKGSKKGDFVVTLANPPDLRLVVETKATGSETYPSIEETMEEALENREAAYGLFVVRDVESVPRSVGWFNEYQGRFLVVALGSRGAEDRLHREMLEVAYRWARTRVLLRRAARAEGVDVTAVRQELERAETVLKRFRRIRTQCTNVSKAVQAIREEAKGIQEDLKEILDRIGTEVAPREEGE